MGKLKLIVVILLMGAVWYVFHDSLYRGVTGFSLFGTSEYNDPLLDKPAIQAYEKFLDNVGAMSFLSDIEDDISSSYFKKFVSEFAGANKSVNRVKDWHELSAMEYINIEYDRGNSVGFRFVGSSKDVLRLRRSSYSGPSGGKPEGLIDCFVGMSMNNGKWLLINQQCDVIPEIYMVTSGKDKSDRKLRLAKYYRKRFARIKSE